MFHNARELLERGSGPYFYLPKLESHLEARLWAQAFALAEEELGIAPGSIRCTVLIETILAAFEMDEILYELRDYGCSLNAGRWDYIFSCIKKFRTRDWVLPDRVQVTMAVPFMRAYTELLVATCHKRGAHAIGGMAAFIPSRKDPEVNRGRAREGARGQGARVERRLRRDLGRASRSRAGRDRDLRRRARRSAEPARPAARGRRRRTRQRCSRFRTRRARSPSRACETNVSVGIRYLDAWLHGVGAAAIDNLMEDAATAEISRSQVWQWVRAGRFDADDVRREAAEVEAGEEAKELFLGLALAPQLVDFLTVPAYTRLD